MYSTPPTSKTLKVKRNSSHLERDHFAAFASCPRGVEPLLAEELSKLGAITVKNTLGGVEFTANWAALLYMNLWSRLAGRVYLQLANEPCQNDTTLYKLVKKIPWDTWFSETQTLRVDLNNLGLELPNQRFLQLRVKDAICDYFRDKTGKRPSIDTNTPEIRVLAGVGLTHTRIYIDLSGENLFKRGWRQDKGNAPLKENLAAALLKIAQWQPETPLLDPFCGSGTILIEAACIASDRAPGLNRPFAFENLKGFDPGMWEKVKQTAQNRFQQGLKNIKTLHLVGSDITRFLIETAQHNAQLAGLQPLLDNGQLRFEQRDARTIEPKTTYAGQIITNPPYGERLQAKGEKSDADHAYLSLFKDLGTCLKQQFQGWTFHCLSADLELRHAIGLSPKRKTPLFNGGLECRFFEFPLTQGNYRPRANHQIAPSENISNLNTSEANTFDPNRCNANTPMN